MFSRQRRQRSACRRSTPTPARRSGRRSYAAPFSDQSGRRAARKGTEVDADVCRRQALHARHDRHRHGVRRGDRQSSCGRSRRRSTCAALSHRACRRWSIAACVIVHVGGHNRGALTAFDANTGAVKWKWTGDGPSYGSPMAVGLRRHASDRRVHAGERSSASRPPPARCCEAAAHARTITQNVITPIFYGDTGDRVGPRASRDHGVQDRRSAAISGPPRTSGRTPTCRST